MLKAIADTHTVIWYIWGDSRLSQTAKSTIDQISQNGDTVGVSVITIVEMIYLIEKGKIAKDTLTKLNTEINQDDAVLIYLSLDEQIAKTLAKIKRDEIPDLPDRLIASTALYYQIPLISRDRKITASRLTTIW